MSDIDNNEEYYEKEMGFLDHLEELRWRIIKALIGVIVAGIVIGIFVNFIVDNIILAPSAHTVPPIKIINIKPFGQFTLYMEVILIGGIILSIPNIIYQFWKFIEPALRPSERRYISAIVIFTSFCFISGIVFAYFVMLPTALNFLAQFGTAMIENSISIDEYVSFVVSMCLVAGIVFELPMVSFFLSKIGILKPQFMRKYRKHAIVAILIISGILTPSPDVTSMLLLAVPLCILYEISIIICKVSQKKSVEENLVTS